ncbi:MAG: DNA methyltransferase [Actinomycetota bacterium]|nr:DNA methyltransferase [Actinomycetota bacterium]
MTARRGDADIDDVDLFDEADDVTAEERRGDGTVLDLDELADGGLGDIDGEAAALPQRLTDQQVEEIASLLRAGRRLPPHLFPNLFESPREYQLSYRGKARRADILADTMAVPLQPVRAFGAPDEGWSNMLVFGDNLQVLRQLLNLKDRGELRNPDGSDGVRVCYIDPPFASQQEFSGSRNEKAYLDNVAGAEFVEHLRRRLVLIRELLTDDGSLVVHLDTRKAHYIKIVLDELFGEGNFRNEIIWKRTTSHSSAQRFAPVHDVLLYYVRGPAPVWNPPRTDYDEAYLDKYYRFDDGDGRLYWRADLTAAGVRRGATGRPWRGFDPTAKGRHWMVPPDELDKLDADGKVYWPSGGKGWPQHKRYREDLKGKAVSDLWDDIDRINPVGHERLGYPTQKPLALVERIIETCTRPGDIVLDAFVGSGTTAVAAQSLAEPRRWVAIDSGKFAIYVTQARLLRGAREAATPPFTLYNAGLYDYRALRELPRDEYVDFVLEMFQCRKVTHQIGGVTFHGYIGDDPVLVYDFKKHPDARIGEQFVDDLSSVCRSGLGQRCFIIAPSTAVEPYEDYLTIGETRFFFLRIPYSVISELHKRAFSDLRQPTSEARTNAAVDAVGFDFIQPPNVHCRFTATADTLDVKIESFESEAFAATPSSANIADLAMVLVDYAYDDEVFNLRSVHFADDLASNNWTIRIQRSAIGERLMLVYVDLYGNEHREVLTPDQFEGPPGSSSRVKRATGGRARPARKGSKAPATTTAQRSAAAKTPAGTKAATSRKLAPQQAAPRQKIATTAKKTPAAAKKASGA